MLEEMIENIGLFWTLVRQNRAAEAVQTGKKIQKEYISLTSAGKDCMALLDEIFEGAADMYMVTLSVLYYLLKEEEFLKKAEAVICKEELDVFLCFAIRFSITFEKFRQGFDQGEYAWQQKVHGSLVNMFRKKLSVPVSSKEAVKKRIVLMSDVFLVAGNRYRGNHAPTEIVEKFYDTLRYQMGYDIFLLITPCIDSETNVEDYWFRYSCRNYMKEMNGDFHTKYHGRLVEGYQQPIGEKYIPDIIKTIERIESFRPELIFYIGGECVMPEILSGIAPVIAMPCTHGYSVSEAAHMVSYMGEGSKDALQAEAYFQKTGQRTYHLKLPTDPLKLKAHYQKSDFGFSNEDFIIAVMGNRIETEIDHSFLELMEKIIVQKENCYFCLIGKYEKEISSAKLRKHIKFLGYREDYKEVLAVTDLFLNPKRMGAAGGAAASILVGVPVLTLPDCDVAASVSDEFVCDNYDEMYTLVDQYICDKVFYQTMVEKCRQLSEQRYAVDLKKELIKLFDQVRKNNSV